LNPDGTWLVSQDCLCSRCGLYRWTFGKI